MILQPRLLRSPVHKWRNSGAFVSNSINFTSMPKKEKSSPDKPFFESDAGDGTKREDQYLTGVKLAACGISVCLCLFLFALDQTIVATLLTDVGNHFNSFNQIGWLSTGFLISMCVLVTTWGKLSIIFGRKNTMIAGVILFEIGSLLCALANSMNMLIGGRVLAGVGGGGIQTTAFIIITEVVPIQQRPLAMALVASTFAVASVMGPLVGGAFTSNVTWRWCFYINLPIGGIALAVFAYIYNPPKVQGTLKEKLRMIDYLGIFLCTGGLVVVLLGLTFGSQTKYSWDSAAVIACFVVGGVVTIAYFIWNFAVVKHPMLPWEIVRVIPVLASAVTMFGVFAYFIASFLYLSVYFQVIHNASAWKSGVHLLPEIIAVVLMSFMSGVLVHKTRFVKPFAVVGACLGLLGCGLVTLLEVDSSNSKKIGLMIPIGLGVGILMQSGIIGAQISAPKLPGSTILATTFVNFTRTFGGALAGTLADAVYTASYNNHIHAAVAKLTSAVQSELSKFDLKELINSTEAIKRMSPAAQMVIKKQIMKAIKDVFYMNLGFAVIGVVGCIFITNQRLPTATNQVRDGDTPKPDTETETEAEALEPKLEPKTEDPSSAESVSDDGKREEVGTRV